MGVGVLTVVVGGAVGMVLAAEVCVCAEETPGTGPAVDPMVDVTFTLRSGSDVTLLFWGAGWMLVFPGAGGAELSSWARSVEAAEGEGISVDFVVTDVEGSVFPNPEGSRASRHSAVQASGIPRPACAQCPSILPPALL